MPMFENIWNRILDWFHDWSEWQRLLQEFNYAAREAFCDGVVPTMLKASVSRGNDAWHTSFMNGTLMVSEYSPIRAINYRKMRFILGNAIPYYDKKQYEITSAPQKRGRRIMEY